VHICCDKLGKCNGDLGDTLGFGRGMTALCQHFFLLRVGVEKENKSPTALLVGGIPT